MDERPEHKRYNDVRGPDLHSCQQYSSSVTRDSMAGGRVCLTDARKGLFSALVRGWARTRKITLLTDNSKI